VQISILSFCSSHPIREIDNILANSAVEEEEEDENGGRSKDREERKPD
jgi:hypothetical protein